jgi:hypothetical protein
MGDIDFREIIRVIIIGGGAAILGLSYVAVYLMGKNAAREARPPRRCRRVCSRTGWIASRLQSIDRARVGDSGRAACC